MENLITEMAKALVDQPSAVALSTFGNDHSIVYELRVAKTDIGKIIGRKGRTIQSMRNILNAAAARNGKRIILEVLD